MDPKEIDVRTRTWIDIPGLNPKSLSNAFLVKTYALFRAIRQVGTLNLEAPLILLEGER